jgi:hypothetical protein
MVELFLVEELAMAVFSGQDCFHCLIYEVVGGSASSSVAGKLPLLRAAMLSLQQAASSHSRRGTFPERC